MNEFPLRRFAAIVAVTTAMLAWVLAGLAGAAYFVLLILASTTGWPVGMALFGRHPIAIIGGSAVGYAFTAMAVWIGVRAGMDPAVGLLVWTAIAAAGWIALRHGKLSSVFQSMLTTTKNRLPEWRVGDSRALAALLVLTAVVVVPPFARVGAERPDGTRLYRAYFTADFVWHMALTAELAKGDMPPRNPYLNGERLHYYWTYFQPPAAAVRVLPLAVESALKVTALFAALTFMASIFALAWTAVPRGSCVLAAVAFGLLAASFEGTYALVDLYQRDRPLSGVTDLNIDALSAWRFGGLRIDGLARATWYNPQHSMALALAIPALISVTRAGASLAPSAVLLVGICLAGAMTFNPFVGALVAMVYGLSVIADVVSRRLNVRFVGLHLLATVPMVVALVWAMMNEVAEGAGGAIRVGFAGPAARQPLLTMLLSLGPLLLAAAPGFLFALRGPDRARLTPAAIGCGVTAAAMFGMRLNVDEAWIGFRTGHILQVLLIVLVAGTVSRARSRVAIGLIGVLALFGLSTTGIDYWNAQDVGNSRMGPGFRWTVEISPHEQAVLDWIRTQTPPDAVVQMDALVRTRETWSLIPSFAERRMAAGLPISLLNVPEYRNRSERVHSMYAATDAMSAWRIAQELGIAYVYADRVERAAHPGGLAQFDQARELFQPAARRGDVAVWRVLVPGG